MKQTVVTIMAVIAVLALAISIAAASEPTVKVVCVDNYEYVVASSNHGISIVQSGVNFPDMIPFGPRYMVFKKCDPCQYASPPNNVCPTSEVTE
jgi:hypothetical protein